MKIINFFKKAIRYVRTHTFSQVIKRILGKRIPSDPTSEYLTWIDNNEPKSEELDRIKKFVPKYKYKFIFILKSDANNEVINSIQQQTYSNFQIIQYSKNSDLKDILYNTIGDYFVLVQNECILSKFMLYEVLRKIDLNTCDVIYSDSDKIVKVNNKDGTSIEKRIEPVFKPDFAIDTLRSKNYIGNCIVIRKESLIKNKINVDSKLNNIIFDIMFKSYENNLRIAHIPKVLYHDNVVNCNKNNYDEEIKIINSHLQRSNIKASLEEGKYKGQYHIVYDIADLSDKISIIIPNMDHVDDLKKCIESIKRSTYSNYEIIIVENNSKMNETFEYYNELKNDVRIKIEQFDIDYFNYSKIVNFGVQKSTGKYIILLNNDIEIISNNWIEEMLMYANRDDVGIVGAKLLFSDNSIQHAGVIIGIRGLAGHLYREVSNINIVEYPDIDLVQDLSAVTAACLMVKRSIFDSVRGFDYSFAVNFNDVDFCLKVREKGYLVVYNPNVQAYHYESKSRGLDTESEEKRKRFELEYNMFVNRWEREIKKGDPFYNKNYRLDDDVPKINYNKIIY